VGAKEQKSNRQEEAVKDFAQGRQEKSSQNSKTRGKKMNGLKKTITKNQNV